MTQTKWPPVKLARFILAAQESSRLEMKGSFFISLDSTFKVPDDHYTGQPQKRDNQKVRQACVKTVAAMANTDGGTLLVGVLERDKYEKWLPRFSNYEVTHDKIVLGVEFDLRYNVDNQIRKFQDDLKKSLGADTLNWVNIVPVLVNGVTVVYVSVRRLPNGLDAWLDGKFYVRQGPTTVRLTGEEITNYKNSKDHVVNDENGI